MAQSLTIVFLFAVAIGVSWWLRQRRAARDDVKVSIRLDGVVPGAHLIWKIENTSAVPITLSSFVIHPRRRAGDSFGDSAANVLIADTETLQPGERARLTMDVDWRLFDARTIAMCDTAGREHLAPAAQLGAVQAQLHDLVERRTASAPDWLRGAANLTFGVVILGLGFFMLMWVIATG